MLYSLTFLALPYFSTLSHKRHDFRKKTKVTEYKMCVLMLHTIFFNISHYGKNSVTYNHKNAKVFIQSTRYSCQILTKPNFSRKFFEKYSISNFMKIRPV